LNLTGLFFDKQEPESLVGVLKKFKENDFDPKEIRNHALKFDKEIFKKKIKEFVDSLIS